MQTTTIGVFGSKTDAEGAITELEALHISNTDISYMYESPETHTTIIQEDDGNRISAGTTSGATTGVILGAIAGFAVANGLLPGLGTLFVAGPLAAALGLTGVAATTTAGAITGLAAGGIVGALGGIGVDATQARVYEERVKRGEVLVSARSSWPTKVRDIFRKYGAGEIREYAKA